MVPVSNCFSVSKYTVWLMVGNGMIKEQGMFLLSTLRYEKKLLIWVIHIISFTWLC
jgi:hypothetical protein